MVRISFSPEGFVSLGKLPESVGRRFNEAFALIEQKGPDPRVLDTHQLSGTRSLWTLRMGAFRGIYRRDGHEARFTRFGHRSIIYRRLPK